MVNSCKCTESGLDNRTLKVLNIIEKHKEVKGGLIPVLHGIQELYGYLPEEALRMVSDGLEIPMTEIYGVATFYHYFSLVQKGEHVIRVCLGTACYVKGSQLLVKRLTQELGIGIGETTKDNKFTLEATRCLGACGLAPVMTIDNKVYGKVTLEDIRRILDEYLIKEHNN
ncbi:NADH-quinone oxidoreductase subunit NuoE [Candidatus Clostridium stratigraminis]|uniref:NADH-quinone oxidoreductase subunit NuoE n=1 Tax=Candidatus Clostridium stratigraminis TaxID=3381661 RepID=A0ABW8T754_9CLOT